ncbi:uncharacterized protein STEHIDRAFT_70249 [Stereum hirsutum FP-91666 SS1]|uniref:uncharacterized protein n=1 Tax=Stereum hirsutum (strain FP-91666) TaxID=721885 RepID=UPI000440A1D4|nr:uncharacterized protein STEHIDRAFT_70249 [Stereum hirsutum FP-91666 SS1]EIM91828.1 hypothetical protein STEHIDRAFT_70249 [Stereum hirsutum FP-91666 SS1]
MASLFRAYNRALIQRPFLTQCLSSAVLFGAGDVLAQEAVEKRGWERYDPIRTLRLSLYGGAFFGPPVTKWFQFLGRLQFASPTKAVVYRTFLDQSLMAPLAVGWFFTSMTFLEGKGVAEVQDRLSKSYVPTVFRNWCVFIPTQILNFSIMPPQLRFVFVGVVSLFWNTYLSAVNAADAAKEELGVIAPVVEMVEGVKVA